MFMLKCNVKNNTLKNLFFGSKSLSPINNTIKDLFNDGISIYYINHIKDIN